MSFRDTLRRLFGNANKSTQYLAEIVSGTANQSRLINDKLNETMSGVDGQTRQLCGKLDAVIEGLDNQSQLLNSKLEAVVLGLDHQSRRINEKLDTLIKLQAVQFAARDGDETLGPGPGQSGQVLPIATRETKEPPPASFQMPPSAENEGEPNAMPLKSSDDSAFRAAMQQIPLLLDEKTYNTSHPEYDATAVRNYPGQIFNAEKPCGNIVYAEIKKLAKGGRVRDKSWKNILKETLEEARAVPHSEQVFERRAFIEKYTAELNRKYGGHYAAGWVNLDDAIFLYWLVRHLNPKTIVQTGVCNGLSSAFMMLALAKNGPNGKLHLIDLPPVFDSNDPAWTAKDKVYGVTIPEGKSSGWMVPDAYQDRYEVWNGDAKDLLPKMVDELDTIDMFYHDSDHTYNHMMFEFREAKRKLVPGGLIVGDDVSWNASVWDFADEYGAPSYNYKGAVGVAFF